MKIRLEDIIKQIGLYIFPGQINYFCNDEELVNYINSLIRKNALSDKQFENLLVENQDKLDVEKILLTIIYNYSEEITNLESILNDNSKLYENKVVRLDSQKLKKVVDDAKQQYIIKSKIRERAQQLGKGMDKVIVLYNFDNNKQRFRINIVDSKEYIDGISRSKTKNLKLFNKIDKQLKQIDGMNGVEEIFRAINFSDFEVIFEDENFGYELKTLILENKAIEDGIVNVEELNRIREKDLDAYYRIFESLDLSTTLGTIKNGIEENIQYVDINKMLMTCAFRLEEKSEEGKFDNSIKPIVEVIYDNLKRNNKEYHLDLYFHDGTEWVKKEVIYSTERVKRFLDKFTRDSYLTESDIKETRERIQSGEINLFDTRREKNDIIFTDEQLEDVALLSDENLAYVAMRLNWNREKTLEKIRERKACSGQVLDVFVKYKKIELTDVTELYLNDIVSEEEINEFKKLSKNDEDIKLVSPRKLIGYYYESVKEDATEESKQRFEKYAELYKIIKLQNNQEKEESEEGDTTEESGLDSDESKEAVTELMEVLIEDYDQEEKENYIKIQVDLYKKGILSINDLVEWNNEGEDFEIIISQLYMQDKIDILEIGRLLYQERLGLSFIEKLEREKRIELLSQGFIDEENIYILFLENDIDENELLQLADLNIVNKPKAESMVRNKNNSEDSQFQIDISGNLEKISYDPVQNSLDETDNIHPYKKNRTIIDPDQRRMFFDLLGARRVNHVIIPKDSPFYEYEFFALPDENGEFSNDSVIIAERFYEETEEHIKQKIEAEREKQLNGEPKTYYINYATDNATYFFRGRDIKVLNEYTNKTEVIGNDDIVFKVDHNLADDKKVGSWASGVLYAITKAMLSSDFKGKTKREQREITVDTLTKYYGHKKFLAILDKLDEIDNGEHNGDIGDEYVDIDL